MRNAGFHCVFSFRFFLFLKNLSNKLSIDRSLSLRNEIGIVFMGLLGACFRVVENLCKQVYGDQKSHQRERAMKSHLLVAFSHIWS